MLSGHKSKERGSSKMEVKRTVNPIIIWMLRPVDERSESTVVGDGRWAMGDGRCPTNEKSCTFCQDGRRRWSLRRSRSSKPFRVLVAALDDAWASEIGRTGGRHQTDEPRAQTACTDPRPQHNTRPRAHKRNPNDEATKPVEASEDDTDDVTVVGFTMKPTVPVPAFIAAAIMDTYVTAPEELALLIVNAIKQRASEDPDPSRATIRAEAASTSRGGSSAIQVHPAAVGGRRFVFPACDFLKERLGRGVDQKGDSQPVAAAGSARAGRRGQPADAVTNPQQDLFPRDANDTWQVFLDHVRSGPIPNMCCRWHLNGKCVKSCFLSLARRPHDRTDDRRTSVDRAVPGAHAPPLVRRDAAQQENKIRTLCICLLPARLRRTAVAMGVRPGTVDGRVPQQTPRRTPRTLSESAARDSPAGTHAHEPSPRHVADAPHLSPARDDPSRNEVGPERYAPPSTRHRPTTPWRAHCRPETPTTRRHQPSQTRHARFPVSSHRWCHCRRSCSRTSTRRSHDSRTTPGRCPCHYFALRPTAHPRDGVSLRLDARRRPPQPRGAQTVRLDLDAALRAQPFSALTPGSEFRPTELRPAPVRPPLWPRFQERISEGAEFRFARSRILTASRTCAPT
ncbi:hypothetical protein MHU86_14519 [Fragilaria crotonensis]|nr:hypothetical protein MHU86_14519 [Fragilaria crotonensis]